MTPRAPCWGTSTRIGIGWPSADMTVRSSARDIFGPGPAIAANDADSWRASVGRALVQRRRPARRQLLQDRPGRMIKCHRQPPGVLWGRT